MVYNIVFFLRRKKIDFKGDFLVNDSTYAIKKIIWQTKS
jgi:hypothetical protein